MKKICIIILSLGLVFMTSVFVFAEEIYNDVKNGFSASISLSSEPTTGISPELEVGYGIDDQLQFNGSFKIATAYPIVFELGGAYKFYRNYIATFDYSMQVNTGSIFTVSCQGKHNVQSALALEQKIEYEIFSGINSSPNYWLLKVATGFDCKVNKSWDINIGYLWTTQNVSTSTNNTGAVFLEVDYYLGQYKFFADGSFFNWFSNNNIAFGVEYSL